MTLEFREARTVSINRPCHVTCKVLHSLSKEAFDAPLLDHLLCVGDQFSARYSALAITAASASLCGTVLSLTRPSDAVGP